MKTSAQVLEAIETAIQVEKDGFAFYSEAAERIESPKGRRMFKTLAKDEAAHLKLFEDARRALLETGEWPSPEAVEAVSPRRSVDPGIFPKGGDARSIEVPEHQLKVLQRGIKAEEDSIAFYTEQRDQVDDPDARAMYAYLIEQEEGHRTILQGEYDYLAGTGFWFDFGEFDLSTAG
jgi:rubrerythrin